MNLEWDAVLFEVRRRVKRNSFLRAASGSGVARVRKKGVAEMRRAGAKRSIAPLSPAFAALRPGEQRGDYSKTKQPRIPSGLFVTL